MELLLNTEEREKKHQHNMNECSPMMSAVQIRMHVLVFVGRGNPNMLRHFDSTYHKDTFFGAHEIAFGNLDHSRSHKKQYAG